MPYIIERNAFNETDQSLSFTFYQISPRYEIVGTINHYKDLTNISVKEAGVELMEFNLHDRKFKAFIETVWHVLTYHQLLWLNTQLINHLYFPTITKLYTEKISKQGYESLKLFLESNLDEDIENIFLVEQTSEGKYELSFPKLNPVELCRRVYNRVEQYRRLVERLLQSNMPPPRKRRRIAAPSAAPASDAPRVKKPSFSIDKPCKGKYWKKLVVHELQKQIAFEDKIHQLYEELKKQHLKLGTHYNIEHHQQTNQLNVYILDDFLHLITDSNGKKKLISPLDICQGTLKAIFGEFRTYASPPEPHPAPPKLKL